MHAEAAEALLKATATDRSVLNPVICGLALLAEVRPGQAVPIAVEHDRIYAGDFAATVAAMTEEQVASMARWGWSTAMESWSHWL